MKAHDDHPRGAGEWSAFVPLLANGSHSAGPARDHYRVFCFSCRGAAVLEQALRATASGRVRQRPALGSRPYRVSSAPSVLRADAGRQVVPPEPVSSAGCARGPSSEAEPSAVPASVIAAGEHGVHRSDSLAARCAHYPALRPHASDSSSRSLAVMAGAFAPASTS